MSVKPLGRRTVLRGAGGIALALPFLEAMLPVRRAHAAPPRRFVLFFTPNGTNDPGKFYPQGTGANFTLGYESEPLLPYKSDMVFLSGINMESAKLDGGDLHAVGMSHMLTGVRSIRAAGYSQPGGGSYYVSFAGGISIDQEIAKHIGGTNRFRTLEFGVQSINGIGVHPFSRMSYSGPNQPVPAEDDPRAMFMRLFGAGGGTAPAPGGVPTAPTPASAIDALLAQRRSTLDVVKDDFQRLSMKLGTADRAKLDRHMTALREVERKLALPSATGGGATPPITGPAPTPPPAVSSASCKAPANPTGAVMNPNDPAQFPAIGQLQMDLMMLALACDLTRVASIQWSWARSQLVHPWAMAGNRSHHDMSHGSASMQLSAINRWFASQLAYLIKGMKAIDEGGTSLLDSSLVYWCGECALGADHNFNNIRAVLFGKAGGGLRGHGQHIAYRNEKHNNLLISLLNAMGVPATTFGDPMFVSGPLAGLV